MILTLVALPTIAPLLNSSTLAISDPGALAQKLGITLVGIVMFFAVMMLVGRRVIPAILHYIAHTGSRELLRLGVLDDRPGCRLWRCQAFRRILCSGGILCRDDFEQSPRISRPPTSLCLSAMPLRSCSSAPVGMLFNPLILVEHPASVLATVAIIIVGKALAALAIVLAFGYPMRTALLIAVSLGQIGEFSFILANLGVALQLLPAQGRELILAGALISIMLNPLLFHLLETFGPAEVLAKDPAPNQARGHSKPTAAVTTQTGHTVLVGYGRVGSVVGERLLARGEPIFVIEDREDAVAALRERKIEVIAANAVNALRSANLAAAKRLIIAVPDCFKGRPDRRAGARHKCRSEDYCPRPLGR